MPSQTAPSNFAAKLGNRFKQAHEKHKNDDTTYGSGVRLPDGIENGIAQLTEAYFDTHKDGKFKGETFFRAAGTVISPQVHNSLPVAGLHTSIIVSLYDTPDRKVKSFDEHYAEFLNELRKLGVDTKTLKPDVGSLNAALTALTQTAPHFRFRTWKGSKQTSGPYAGKEPRTVEEWLGAVEYSPDGNMPEPVMDQTSDDAPTDDAPADDTDATASGDEAVDIDALVATASQADDEAETVAAREQIEALGEQWGVHEEVVNANDWEAAGEVLKGAQLVSDADAPAEEEAPWEPAVGEIYRYRPIDPKTKKAVAKAINVEVSAVYPKTSTVDVFNPKDKKAKWLKVKWDAIIHD